MSSDHKSWLRRRVEAGLLKGLTQAYETVKVNPDKFLIQLRAAYDLPVTSFKGMHHVEIGQLDRTAASILRSSTKMAAVQGAGFGLQAEASALHGSHLGAAAQNRGRSSVELADFDVVHTFEAGDRQVVGRAQLDEELIGINLDRFVGLGKAFQQAGFNAPPQPGFVIARHGGWMRTRILPDRRKTMETGDVEQTLLCADFGFVSLWVA